MIRNVLGLFWPLFSLKPYLCFISFRFTLDSRFSLTSPESSCTARFQHWRSHSFRFSELTCGKKYTKVLSWTCVRYSFTSRLIYRATFIWPWKIVSVSVRYLFYQPVDEKIKTWPLRFPAKQNPNTDARLYPFDKPIKSLYFRSFVVSVLFARFHFKVIRKSLQQKRKVQLPHGTGLAHQHSLRFIVGDTKSIWQTWRQMITLYKDTKGAVDWRYSGIGINGTNLRNHLYRQFMTS